MQRDISPGSFLDLFVTGGMMGGLIRYHDWSQSKLGEMQTWPQSLQSAVSICINSNFPIAIYWGDDLTLIYNDAWSPIPGNKHPWALGKPARDVWPEIWPDIAPQFEKAFKGVPGGSKDALLPMQRHGYTEECYFDFTFTPIYGASGKVEGIFNAVIETTYRVINERRALLLQKLSDAVNAVTEPQEVFIKAAAIFEDAKTDISFYSILEFDHDAQPLTRVASKGFDLERWPLESALSGQLQHMDDIGDLHLQFPSTYWPEKPTEAVLIPLKSNDGSVFGCVIAGLSARRRFDKDYRTFFESVGSVVAGELNTIKSLAEERRRAQSLAELDKAKTVFFSNISHEFRTPLTLMIGPLQTILDNEGLPPEQREILNTAYRNTLRLQKLVNTLLDFSRIESGKMEASFDEVDIVKCTEDLASVFRSAIESAGIEYHVVVNPLSKLVCVDVDMWEKIVLNLISNAFKYTIKGKITVRVSADENSNVILEVSDTGIGITPEDQVKIFERFYRVNHSDGRTQEGTGIGLSLVKELVALHGGDIQVNSEPGVGSTFIVRIPIVEKVASKARRLADPPNNMVSSYIEQAFLWSDNAKEIAEYTGIAKHQPSDAHKPRVILADDNSDMRAYITRLLQENFNVKTVSNGEQAFSLALDWNPDLILSDVMMPKLDGFGLLKKLRASLITRSIPVIFLSAKAGEEARVEGITAGADDYLVKPFSAKELVARVTNQILISKTRRQTEKEFYNLFLQAPAHIHVMKGPEHVMEFFHPLGKKFTGGRDITGMKLREALPEVDGQGYFEMLDQVYNEGKLFHIPESKVTFADERGVSSDYYFNITYLPLRDVAGKIDGVLQFTTDATQQVLANRQIKENEERFKLLVSSIPQIIWIADTNSNIEFLSEPWERYTGINVDEGRRKFSSFIHEEDIGQVRQRWHESIRLKQSWKSEYRLINAQTGEYRWFFGHTLPLLDEKGDVIKWIGSASDIHAQKMANEELEGVVAERTSELIALNKMLKDKNDELSRAQTFLQTVLDSSVELVTAFDKDLNFTFANNTSKLQSYAGEKLIGKNLLEIHPDYKSSEMYEQLQLALSGQTVHIEANRTSNEDSRIFETFVIPLKRGDEITGVVTMQRDVTTIIKLTEDLRLMNDRLKRSNYDLQQFAHVTSHDLKEPVRKIKVFGNFLKADYSQYLPDRGKDYLSKIERAAGRISAMIDGVLQYSSVEGFDEPFKKIDLNAVIHAIREDLEVAIHDAGAIVNCNDLPIVNGSPTLIYQLFYNLINNSLKFRSKERRAEVSIGAGSESIDGQEYFRIDLRDNGIGFDPSFAERIFESFARLNPKDKYEGTGLGLALCKKIVLRHGGIIRASGEENVGAAFSILLPK